MGNDTITDIGPWSEVKLEIINKYAAAYSKILSRQSLKHIYIDAFSGAGEHVSRTTGEKVKGSPAVALEIQPPFEEYHFIDISNSRAEHLNKLSQNRRDVKTYADDCNKVLVEEVFPNISYAQYKRALCLIDPYGLHLDWEVLKRAGQSRVMEVFLNFPMMDMNMNVLKHDRSKVHPTQKARMTRFWGDETWEEVAYDDGSQDLFGYQQKVDGYEFVDAFRERLRKVADFAFVPEPLAMRNSTNSVVYYLFFASPNKTGEKIVSEIFTKYR